ncbi:MAG: hypothetical protein CL917_02670 [Deltaproteobacteria bacterium]|nr:hypothetical protein [Deltaproteobacteria bacterium]
MSFEVLLKKIVSECPGVLGAALVGEDGLLISQAGAGGWGEEANLSGDMSMLGVEIVRAFRTLAQTSREIEGGSAMELMIRLEKITLIASRIDNEVLLILGVAPDGNLGKARYLMRRENWAILQEI